MLKVVVQNISFDPDGETEVSYYLPDTDVKAPGVARMQTLLIPTGFEYDDEINAVIEAARMLVLDVLEDFEALPTAFPAPAPE
jgi:phosphoribosylformylglycinamidine (FGAM) synthase-like amidotransferase family enzyme